MGWGKALNAWAFPVACLDFLSIAYLPATQTCVQYYVNMMGMGYWLHVRESREVHAETGKSSSTKRIDNMAWGRLNWESLVSVHLLWGSR